MERADVDTAVDNVIRQTLSIDDFSKSTVQLAGPVLLCSISLENTDE